MDDYGRVIGIEKRSSCGDDFVVDPCSEAIRAEIRAKDELGAAEVTAFKKTTLCDLPRQVWLKIHEHIDYSTYLNLRLVNKHFLHLVDEYIGFRVSFTKACDGNPEMFNFFSGVGLNDVQFEDAGDLELYNFSKIFKYPNYLTDVSFTGETNLKLVQDIILNCHCLELVEMTMDCKLTNENQLLNKFILPEIDITSPTISQKSYLRYAQCLKLVPGVQNDDNLRSHLVLSLLRATRSANFLRKVIFQCQLSSEITLAHVLRVTAELLERHPKVEAFFMALLNDEYLLSAEESRKYSHFMDLEGREVEEQLDYFRRRITATAETVQMKKMGLAVLNTSMQLIWGDFLKSQRNLVHLSLTVTIQNGTFTQEFFDAFSGTLEQLAIRGKFEVAFDFLHISNCRSLKEICLHNLQENGGGGITPKCINLPQVSDSLESLILFQVVTRTEEIKEALCKLDRLSTLVLFKCGHAAGETGVGLELLQRIFNKRSLQSILMVQFICSSTNEAEALAGILYKLAQDIENQTNRRGRRREHRDQQGDPPEVENVLELPIIEDGRDQLLYPLVEREGREREAQDPEEELDDRPPSPTSRPVSRGNHRNLFSSEEESSEAAGVSCFPTSEEHDGRVEMIDERSYPNHQSIVEFPPLPVPDASNAITETPHDTELSEVSELNQGEETLEANNAVDGGQNNPLNMLQNILEQAGVDNPENPVQDEYHEVNFDDDDQFLEELAADEMEIIVDVDVVGEDLGGVLDLFVAERLAREHNVQVGFILDGVIDIMNEDTVRSKWLCMEDADGHITYTLKISVEL